MRNGQFLLYKRLYAARIVTPPCHGYTAIHRYTLYSYTALYNIHAIHHPSGGHVLRVAPPSGGKGPKTPRLLYSMGKPSAGLLKSMDTYAEDQLTVTIWTRRLNVVFKN
eukprot:scaffold39986_cov41-Phaeocystis_antarctica.AAC.1